MAYKILLFDADGTLFDFQAAEQLALHHTFEKYHIELTDQIKKRYLDINAQLWQDFEHGLIDKETLVYTRFVKLFHEFHIQEDGVAFEDVYQLELGKGHQLLPDAFHIIQTLSQKYDLYIVTNGVAQTQHSRLKASGLDYFFKNVFISEEIGYQKPKKEFFDYCFAHINNFQKDKTLMIGDSLSSDMQGGILAGIETCWFNPCHQINDKNFPITYEIKDLKELYTFL